MEKEAAINIILATALIAAIIKLVLGFSYYDLDLETVRYQVISGSIPLVFAYGFAGMFSKGRKLAIFSLIMAVIIVVISVTRTYIIVFGVSSFVCLYFYSKTTSRLFGVLVIVIVGAVLAVALTELVPEILGRWNYRLSDSGHDVDLSAAYRLAETEFQLRRLWSDLTGLVFGFGHAAKSGLAGENVSVIANELGHRAIKWSSIGYGHNFYIGLIYVGGLVAGLPVVVVLYRLLWKGLRQVRRTSASPVDRFLLIWAVSAFAGYLAIGMFAGIFGDRSMSFFFGVSAGMVLLGMEPARHDVDQVSRPGPELHADVRTPKQRRAAMARER
jgi:hypothetical protein